VGYFTISLPLSICPYTPSTICPYTTSALTQCPSVCEVNPLPAVPNPRLPDPIILMARCQPSRSFVIFFLLFCCQMCRASLRCQIWGRVWSNIPCCQCGLILIKGDGLIYILDQCCQCGLICILDQSIFTYCVYWFYQLSPGTEELTVEGQSIF
jgi:hypothetical protein